MTPAPLFTRPFFLLFFAHFFHAFGFSSLFLLPVYLDHLGASDGEIGAIMAAAGIGSLVVRPLVGWALDNYGRKPVLWVGTFLVAGGLAMVVWIEDTGAFVYLDRIIFGAGTGALFPGYFTLASDLIPPARRTEGLAIFGIGGLLPLAFNPLFPYLGLSVGDLDLYFLGIGVLVLVSLVFLSGVPEAPVSKTRPQVKLSQALAHMKARSLWSVWLATVVFSGLLAVFAAFATVLATRRGLEDPAALWLTYALGAASVRLLGAKIPDRIGPYNVIAPAMALYVSGILVTAAGQSDATFLLGGALTGMGHGYCFPVLTSQVVSRMPEAFRGSGLAASTGLFELSALMLTPLFGAFAELHSISAMFGLAALSGIGGLALWLALEMRAGGR